MWRWGKENHFVGQSADRFIECKSAIAKMKAINVLLRREKLLVLIFLTPPDSQPIFFDLRDV